MKIIEKIKKLSFVLLIATVLAVNTVSFSMAEAGVPLTVQTEEEMSAILDRMYPIGSIYTSASDINPSELFGGEWQKIEDTFLLAASDTYPAGSTGGSSTHTFTGTVGSHVLTINEMPSHNHGNNTNSLTGTLTINDKNDAGLDAQGSGTGIITAANGTGTGSDISSSCSGNWNVWKGFSINATHSHASQGGGKGHTHTFTGQTIDTMPPYTSVYMWQRIA